MHARYYSPNLGRFLSVDPVGGKVDSSQSWNRYSYVLNNPVNMTDPTGEFPWPLVVAIAFAIGGGAEYANTPTSAQDPVVTDPQYLNSGGMRALLSASKGAALGAAIEMVASHEKNESIGATDSDRPPSVQENKAKGDAFRDEIAEGMTQEGYDVDKEVRKDTPFGPRVIDIEVGKDGEVKGGIETKSGQSRYNPSQRSKDEYLRRQGYPVDVVRDQ